MREQGASVVITHRVRPERHADYERWVDEIAPLAKSAPGILDWQVVRPIAGLSDTYTVVMRFDTVENLRSWMESTERKRLITQVQSMLATGDEFHITSGLDFWFTPAGAKAQVPVRWKQFLVTGSAIFPLAYIVPLFVGPALAKVGVVHRMAQTLAVTAVITFFMVYVVMPRYTKLVHRWLFR